MSRADREMEAALIADGEKLRQLTGEDHGPWELPPLGMVQCPDCEEGIIYESRPFHDDPYFHIEHKCKTCDGLGWLPAEAGA